MVSFVHSDQAIYPDRKGDMNDLLTMTQGTRQKKVRQYDKGPLRVFH